MHNNAIVPNNTLTGEYSGDDIECEHLNKVVEEFDKLSEKNLWEPE